MESYSEENCDIISKIFVFDQEQNSVAQLMRLVTLFTGFGCTIFLLILNIGIFFNIVLKRKFKVAYFNVFILILVFQLLYISINTLILLPPFLSDNCLPESFPLKQIISIASPSSRGCFGIFASIVAALTIERFLSSTSINSLARNCLLCITILLALSLPIGVIICLILINTDTETNEFWFGVEVCAFVIAPLLCLTVFGTVNCCKVSMTSKLLPSHEIQAIKLNIGVTITTNIAVFVFLIQESLHLWISQLQNRAVNGTESAELVLSNLSTAQSFCSFSLFPLTSFISVLYPLVSCLCCCPAINQLQMTEYMRVGFNER